MRKRLYISAGIFLLSPSLSIAQTFITPPEFATIDKNGVDLLSGSAMRNIELGSIGSGEGALSFADHWSGGTFSGLDNNLRGLISYVVNPRNEQWTATVGFANSSVTFLGPNNGPWSLLRYRGHTLEDIESSPTATFRHASGEVRTYTNLGVSGPAARVLTSRSFPSGTTFTYNWEAAGGQARPVSVTSNHGYKIELSYSSNVAPSISVPGSERPWLFVSSVRFYNLGASLSPIFTASRSSVGGNGGTVTATTVSGEVWTVSGIPARNQGAPSQVFSVKTPSSTSPNITFTPVYGGGTTSATAGGATTYYSFVQPLEGQSGAGSATVTDPGGGITKIDFFRSTSRYTSGAMPTKVTDPLNRVTQYTNISGYLIDSVTRPEGDKDIYAYDSRGNITSVTYKAKVGSGLADRVQLATFPTTCTNGFVTCNKPTSTTDARGAVTNYAYDQTHGGILSVMGPPPTPGSARPLKLTTWQQRYAWILNSGGVLVQASTPVWVVATETSCQTAAGSSVATCDPAAQQTVTTYEYGAAQSATTLLVKGVAVSSGGTTLRTCYQYDSAARKIAETTPNANLGVCP